VKAIIIEDKDVHALVEKFRARQASLITRFKQQDSQQAYVADEVCRAIWLDLCQWLQDQGATVVRQ
jgi:hypothetical protein